eukprot:1290710-Rhodomonas_salina.2
MAYVLETGTKVLASSPPLGTAQLLQSVPVLFGETHSCCEQNVAQNRCSGPAVAGPAGNLLALPCCRRDPSSSCVGSSCQPAGDGHDREALGRERALDAHL